MRSIHLSSRLGCGRCNAPPKCVESVESVHRAKALSTPVEDPHDQAHKSKAEGWRSQRHPPIHHSGAVESSEPSDGHIFTHHRPAHRGRRHEALMKDLRSNRCAHSRSQDLEGRLPAARRCLWEHDKLLQVKRRMARLWFCSSAPCTAGIVALGDRASTALGDKLRQRYSCFSTLSHSDWCKSACTLFPSPMPRNPVTRRQSVCPVYPAASASPASAGCSLEDVLQPQCLSPSLGSPWRIV